MKQEKKQKQKQEQEQAKKLPLVPIALAVLLVVSVAWNVVQLRRISASEKEATDLSQKFIAAQQEIDSLQMKVSELSMEAGIKPNPVVTIEMEDGGIIKLELYPDKAPNTVKNFVSLAQKGFYNGVIFHRVIDGFMIQGGDPEGTGLGGPDYRIKAEFANAGFTQNDITHKPGVVSMARQGNPYNPASAYDTAGSQFFICDGDASFLDKDYTAFGMVIEGMDVVERISAVKTDADDRPSQEQKMKTVTVDTFGVDWGEPETIPGR